MKYDELAFLNLQLAGMLKTGIPLEGALNRLCSAMKRGKLRRELELLEEDLAKGIPLEKAVGARKLPELYQRLLIVGSESEDLPGVLTLAADYYQRMDLIWTRLKGLLVYPATILLISFLLSLAIFLIFRTISIELPALMNDFLETMALSDGIPVFTWMPVLFFGILTLLAFLFISVPRLRRSLRWRLPGFKEAGLAQIASSISLMLRGGSTLSDALELLRQLEAKSEMGREMGRWQRRLAEGYGRFPEIAADSRIFPPLFTWVVANGGEDLAEGFQRAGDLYQKRAAHRSELMLYGVLPVSILFLGILIIGQAMPLVRLMSYSLHYLGDLGGSGATNILGL